MAAAGAELNFDLTSLAVMWLLRVLLNLHRFVALLLEADRYFRLQRPDAVVLIDYPGFNWWIARRAKAHQIPVFYYGTPQLWAWGAWRVAKMRRYVDHVLCKLPFEVPWFRERHCHATYVGHPYFDQLTDQQLEPSFVRESARDGRRILTLLPGSRKQEVTGNLPMLLDAARMVVASIPDLRVAIACFNDEQASLARDLVARRGLPFEIHVRRTSELIHLADGCLACSGSVSLELLYHLKPSIIVYRVSRFAMFVQRFFRRVRFITLVNLLATSRLYTPNAEIYDPDAVDAERIPFPEYLTCEDKSTAIAQRVVVWLTDEAARQTTIDQLRSIKERWGTPGASRRAAEYLVTHCRTATESRACA